jgi:uncharacterized SAM-binding protein YcdF (DUF218 family)
VGTPYTSPVTLVWPDTTRIAHKDRAALIITGFGLEFAWKLQAHSCFACAVSSMQHAGRLAKAAGRAAVPVAAGVVATTSQPVAQADAYAGDVLSRRRIQVGCLRQHARSCVSNVFTVVDWFHRAC